MRNLQALEDRLRRHGYRVTRQRRLILEALCALNGHASVEAVHRQVSSGQAGVDLSTVYRTLEKLRDMGLLSQTDLGRGCAEYEFVADRPHHHLICRGCGRVIDLDHAYLEGTAEAIWRDFGFEPVLYHFAIFGLCSSCQQPMRGVSDSGRPSL